MSNDAFLMDRIAKLQDLMGLLCQTIDVQGTMIQSLSRRLNAATPTETMAMPVLSVKSMKTGPKPRKSTKMTAETKAKLRKAIRASWKKRKAEAAAWKSKAKVGSAQ